MIIKDISAAINSIQIVRLEAALRGMQSLSPYSDQASRLINWMSREPGLMLGLSETVPVFDRREVFGPFQRAYNPVGREASQYGSRLTKRARAKADFQEIATDAINDVKDTAARHAANIKSLQSDFFTSVKAQQVQQADTIKPRSHDEQAMQQQLIKDFQGHLEDLPKRNQPMAKTALLHAYKNRYDKAIQLLTEALREKKKLHKETRCSRIERNVGLLADAIGLEPLERDILTFFADSQAMVGLFDAVHLKSWKQDSLYETLGLLLNVSDDDMRMALSPDGALRRSHIIHQRTFKPNTPGSNTLVNYDITDIMDFSIPQITLDSLREDHADATSLVGNLLGKVDGGSKLSINTNFHYLKDPARRMMAIFEDHLHADDPTAVGRKGRLMYGDAGGGKNTLARLMRQEMTVKSKNGKILPVRMHLVGLNLGSLGAGDKAPKQMTGPERIYAWMTADHIAAKLNERALSTGEGHVIILLLDEADKDLLNPEVTGSDAKEGIKELCNWFLENMKTPALVLANVSHFGQSHIVRRLSTPLHVTVPPFEARVTMMADYCDDQGLELSDKMVRVLTEQNDTTPGVIQAVIEDIGALQRRYKTLNDTKPPLDKVSLWMEDAFREVHRANSGGYRPVPLMEPKTDPFDLDLLNPGNPHFRKILEGIAEPGQEGATMLLTGPEGIGKSALVHWFASVTGKRVITIGCVSPGPVATADVSRAIDASLRDNAVILVENCEHVVIAEDTWPIFRFAEKHPLPIFMTLPRLKPLMSTPAKYFLHLDFLQPYQAQIAWQRLLGGEVDPRVQKIPYLTVNDFIQVKNQMAAMTQVGQAPSTSDVLKLLLNSKGMNERHLTGSGTSAKLLTPEDERVLGVGEVWTPRPRYH